MLSSRLRLTPVLRGSLTTPRMISSLPFYVQRGPIQAPTSPIHPNQRVECTWTIRANSGRGRQGRRHDHRHDQRTSSFVQPTAAIEKLKIQTPGVTLVRIVPELLETVGSDVVAQVRVSSNAASVLKAVQITPRWPDRTIVQFQHVDRELFGNLLTEIDLPHAGALRNLAAMGYGDVVIGSDVLMNGDHDATTTSWTGRSRRGCRGRSSSSARKATVQLLATHQSRVFVDAPSTNLQLSSFKLGAMGSASQVHVNVAGLEIARSLELGVLGGERAHVAVHSDTVVASRVKLNCMGDGTTEMVVRKYVDVAEIRALAIGSGVIRMETTARDDDDREQPNERPRCRTQRISSIGTSYIDLATIPTSHAVVKSLGPGDVSLQPRDALRVRSFGSSVVECVGRVPNALDVRGFPAPNLIETPAATQAGGEGSTPTPTVAEPPTMQDAFHREELLYSPCSASAMWSTSWNTSHGK